MEGLTLIIPAYNEEGSLRKCVHETHAFLSAAIEEFEIIIVDDGSTDNTWGIASELSRMFKNVLAERHEANMGIGAAIRTGIGASTRELVFYLPADNQMDIRELPLFLEGIGDADIVSGTRPNGSSSRPRARRSTRRYSSRRKGWGSRSKRFKSTRCRGRRARQRALKSSASLNSFSMSF
jgi:glycosyltransferase involved in cell wall biosynthesis